ncbi:type IV pilin-like G/H family protein [Phormidium sp. LEGE 05292]|uniref:type IV pilin-like G/H family protein n=1 Tax=[Phormidium] sp. LEGE 05292 TaxID=767427 RepID=UPI00187E662F|nr:type IV pilin-like G/H family protein [Phormidium sp. LEGE 05292]MBE9224309.1 type IV pilin-like G/H family protein [Phormidium sp. LEGE 05292]
MNATFKTKFLLHLNQKKNASGEQGFTLIELLVVIIIIGILAAIALPSFLNQANKGKQAEAKQYVSSVNKAQQAYYTETSNFVTVSTPEAWSSLAVGIKTQTTNYKYTIQPTGTDTVSVLADSTTLVTSKSLKNYTGGVGLVAAVAGADKTSQAIVCETNSAGTAPVTITNPGTEVTCGAGMTSLK